MPMSRAERRAAQSRRDKAKRLHDRNMVAGMGEEIKRTQQAPGSAFATFKAAWEDFNNVVIPQDAGEIQRQEMRRAFYAGGMAFYRLQMKQLDSDFDPTEADLARMEGWVNELLDFNKDVQRGKA